MHPHNLRFRYGDSAFAAISRETMHLLRCSITTATTATTATNTATTTNTSVAASAGHELVSASVDDTSSGSEGETAAAAAAAAVGAKLRVAVFAATYEIGGGHANELYP
jgi:hypothetical protein